MVRWLTANSTTISAKEGNIIMSRIGIAVRNRRDSARTRRAVSRAIEQASSPSVRNELLAMAQIQGLPLR
jgi:hypothetical protein